MRGSLQSLSRMDIANTVLLGLACRGPCRQCYHVQTQLQKIAEEDVVAAMSGEGGGGGGREGVFAAVHTCAHAHIHVHVTGIPEARINWLLYRSSMGPN